MYSPWGFIQSKITLSPYVYCVDTPSHGGIMVAIKTAEDILTADALKYSFKYGEYYCFEEDCDAPIVYRELMDKGLYKPPVDGYFTAGEFEKCIDDELKTLRPDYWQARLKRL